MNTNEIILAAALDLNISSSSKSSINKYCIHNLDFARIYDKNIYQKRAIPSKHLAIICCMDARLDVCRILGLKSGEAHIIRNGKSIKDISIKKRFLFFIFQVVVVSAMLFVH
jgi:carbonic anhydrase